MFGRIVDRRSHEHRIAWQASYRAGMFDLHLDPGHHSRKSTLRHSEAVSPKRSPDFEPIQQMLSIQRDVVAIVEFLAPSKHARRQIS